MKYFLTFFVVFFYICEKKSCINLDFCEITNYMHQARSRENQNTSKPLIIDTIKKIEEPSIKVLIFEKNNKLFGRYRYYKN